MPRVSVVVPNYNHERFLERRIQSVLAQTYQDFELILLDDASTDDSARILQKYRGDPRIKLETNDTNGGSPFRQWNRGVQLASGEYIWIAESDDDAESELLGTLVQELDKHPATVLSYCQSWIIDEDGKRLGTCLPWTDDLDPVRWTRSFRNNGCEEARRYLVFKNTILNASAVLFRRSAFLETGGASTSMRISGDRMMWVLLALRGDIAFIATPLNLFRQHSATVRSSISTVRRLHEGFEVVAAIESKVGIPEDLRRALANRLWDEWQSEYLCHRQPIAFSVVYRVGSFLWRMDRGAATKFFLFFLLRKAPERLGLRPARELWRLFKRLLRAMSVRGFKTGG